ncbi:MAG: YigZ family protein [Bacillota bacterium]|nr:YigZ family protein [Bacillota bacterium]
MGFISFKTVLKKSEYQIVVQQSKFICHLFPVKTVSEAENAVESVAKLHYKATHNVPAYLVGEYYKYSDDGEPAGTAGAPLLSMLRNEGFDCICVVVTRYFGGIKLGTGGLVRAYTAALKEALAHAEVSTVALYRHTELEMDYTYLGSVEHYLKSILEQLGQGEALHIADKRYSDKVTVVLYTGETVTDRILEGITEITSATVEIRRLEPILLTDRFEKYES